MTRYEGMRLGGLIRDLAGFDLPPRRALCGPWLDAVSDPRDAGAIQRNATLWIGELERDASLTAREREDWVNAMHFVRGACYMMIRMGGATDASSA